MNIRPLLPVFLPVLLAGCAPEPAFASPLPHTIHPWGARHICNPQSPNCSGPNGLERA